MRKGQITMEALLLYGAAILVVLLAVAALIYFGVLDLGVFLPEKCNIGSSASLTCEEYKISSSADTIDLVLANKGTKSITISAATFAPKDAGMATSCTATTFPAPIIPGSSDQLTITCSSINDEAKGKKLSGRITLTYMYTGGTLTTDTVGDLTATVS